jgi:hypothetical protein
MSTTAAVFAWIGLFVGANVLGAALILLYRVLRPINEIKRYADDILEGGLGIARNLDGADEVVRTRELAATLPAAVRSFGSRKGISP